MTTYHGAISTLLYTVVVVLLADQSHDVQLLKIHTAIDTALQRVCLANWKYGGD
jgi:hypothetical protein